ncbi:hypothetical protein BBJ28_00018077 [Nothophytophthora sp. Chile5]|nr:hypothetical protein BBJ28_00018077 [Nothophytophthora sp. Chile5]
MSFPHRYIPPIYVDLNMPPSSPSSKDKSSQPCSPAPSFTSLLQSEGCSVEPRPSRANSLFLDLLDFPLAAADPNPDVLLKCELDGVLDVSMADGSSVFASEADQPVFPYPSDSSVPQPGQDQELKPTHSQDPEVLEEAAAFPAAIFSAPTISASRPLATPTTNSGDLPPLATQRGGRTSQFSAKQRRERHNANERRRTNAAKDRLRDMRDAVADLERQRGELSAEREAKAAAQEPKVTLPHTRPVEDVVACERVEGELGFSIPPSTTYLELAGAVDKLRDEKRFLEEQLDQLDSQNSAIQAVQAELAADPVVSTPSAAAKKSFKRKRSEQDDLLDAAAESKRPTLEPLEEETPFGGYCMETETVPPYLKVLFPEPLSSDAAFNWVKDSYGDIMKVKTQPQHDETTPESVLGWREDRRQVQVAPKSDDDDDRSLASLELVLSQSFPGVVSGELVFNTWNLLTTLEAFKKVFPLTKDLALLQTVNDDCVVVRVGIAPAHDAPVVHSIMVLARGQIDGGYLISMRSVPLSVGQQAFAAGEERYLPVLAWFMLLDKYDQHAQPVCEVTVGANTQHKSSRTLERLATELVAGAVRWQEAVGQGKRWLL